MYNNHMIKRDKLSIIDFDFCPLTLEITPEESLVIKNKFNWRISKGGSICRKSKNIECTITKEYITQLFFEQNKQCALSGVYLSLSHVNERDWVYNTASLDRIDSDKGYINGNVQ